MIMQCYLLFACALFGAFEAAYVDTLHACPLKDPDCLKNFMQNVIKDLSSQGLPEYNIPPIDPLEVKDVNIPVLNLMDITIVEGVVKGIKDCVVNSFDAQAEEGKAVIDMVCDINIKGRSKILGSSADLENIFGSQTVHGDGNFEVQFTKLQAIITFRYHLIKKDGEVYIKAHEDEFTYKYNLEDAHVSADNIFLGDKDESELVVDYLNQNWKLLTSTFGTNVVDVFLNVVKGKLVQYSDNVAVKYFISDDLSALVKN